MPGQTSFTHEAAEGRNESGQGDRSALTRKASAYQDRWWFTEDGLRLYARDYPASPGRVRLPVICLHGMTRNSADFEELAPFIAQMDRRVIVPDLRGRGLSECDSDPSNYHLWTYAKDVLDLCDALGIGRAIFVGTGMGGLVNMVLSTLRPNLVVSAVVNDIGPVLAPKGVARVDGLAVQKSIALRNWHDAAVFCAEQYRLVYPNHTPADWLKIARRSFIKGKDGLLRQAYDPNSAETFRSMADVASGYEMASCFVNLASGRKILLVRGALSDVLSAPEAKAMAAAAPGLVRVDIDYVGHAPQLSEPVALSAISDFLESQA